MTGIILLTKSNISSLECLLDCVFHLKCKSVNYNQNNKTCKLPATNITENNISADEDSVSIGTPDSEEVSVITWLLYFGLYVTEKVQSNRFLKSIKQ